MNDDEQINASTKLFGAAQALTLRSLGAGRGLSLRKTSIDNHGGSIILRSAHGKGTVTIALPAGTPNMGPLNPVGAGVCAASLGT